MRLALYQPDIPQNTGTILRLGACLDVAVDIIEPCGFVFDDRRFLRAGLDYFPFVRWQRYVSWSVYLAEQRQRNQRLVLLSTKAETAYTDFAFAADDILLLGRESAGVPLAVHEEVDARVLIPLRSGLRSLNIAVAAAMVLGEALRQTHSFPERPLS